MRVLSVLLLIVTAIASARISLARTYREAASEVCRLVEKHYYRAYESPAQEFLRDCYAQAESQNFLVSKADNIRRINDRLSALQTSHLTLYTPEENTAIWEGRSVDSGIRARFVEKELIIYRVLPASAAERAGLQAGDVLISINGKDVNSASEALTLSGDLLYNRLDKQKLIKIEASELTEDQSVTVVNADHALVLRIPSFLPQYFAESDWRKVVKRLGKAEHVVIDLRDNAGGSFPAMLRALSPFRCDDTKIGWLYRQTDPSEGISEADLSDTLDTSVQLSELEGVPKLRLKTSLQYGCYNGPTTVLIDNGTSSVAEIFAEAFIGKAKARVWGQPSAGQVVMAQWFPVQYLGGEGSSGTTSLSIPIAGYQSAHGNQLESLGVIPDRTLYYEIQSAKRGEDNWLHSALEK